MNRREFSNLLAALAAVSGTGSIVSACATPSQSGGSASLYDLPAFGNASVMHFTDSHAQLLPIRFREPSINLGVGDQAGRLPHLVGEHLLNHVGIAPGTQLAHAFTHLGFEEASRRFGKVGGFAHLATLIKQLRATRPGSLLLDGGDSWQGSAIALWTKGQDMVDACLALGVDIMTGHWEFTLGDKRVEEIIDSHLKGKIDFIAHNVRTIDFEDPVFQPYTIRSINGASIAIIGQAFPYTPIANPRYMVPNWSFGIQEANLQKQVDEVRRKGVAAVILLSHNGMDVDLKLASRVRGIDFILGGHTHDGMPVPVTVSNPGGKTVVTNAGSNAKFLGVLDMQITNGRLSDYRYKLLPVFSNLLAPDPAMAAVIQRIRAPYEARLNEVLCTTDSLLYRRSNFNGSWDQLILDGLMAAQNAPIAFSPGFRWGTSILPGEPITRELLMDQVATTYSYATVTNMSGEMIKTVLEDVADNLFNPDPYYQQGGDMVRVGGLTYTLQPQAKMGSRISDMRLGGQLIEASKTYRVAGWAPVAEEATKAGHKQVWEVLEPWLKSQGRASVARLNNPKLIGVDGNPGLSA